MDHIKDLFSRFKARPKPVALEKSPLSRLPKEVLLCIIDHLPASSAASFSVSCLQIQHRIGNRYIKNLSGSSLRSTEDTVEFLNLLKRDLPDQIACSACKKLHKIKHARRYMERRPRSRLRLHPCLFRDCEHRTALYLHGNFSSAVFKMAMKRYNQNNPEHTKLLKLLERKLEKGRDFTRAIHIRQYEAQIRIVNGSLFIRQQMAFYLRSWYPYVGSEGLYFWICPHHTYHNYRNPSYTNSGLQQCNHCRTEYQIDFRTHSRHVLVVYCTQWKDLGAGPDYRTWKAHIDCQPSFSSYVQLNVGEVSSAFQQGEPFEVGSFPRPRISRGLPGYSATVGWSR
jgi:hypothetical protein